MLGIVYPLCEQVAARLDKQARHQFHLAAAQRDHLVGGYGKLVEASLFRVGDRRTEIDRVDARPMEGRHAHGTWFAGRRDHGAG